MKTLVLLDLDRTSFRTDQHFDDFCEILRSKFAIKVDKLKEHEHRISAKPGPYSPLDDIRYSEEITVDPREIIQVANEELKNNNVNYLFDDVEPFLDWHKKRGNPVVLITVGTDEYQEHKRSLVPRLSEYPMIITQNSKSKILNESLIFLDNKVELRFHDIEISSEKVVLIDDRAGTFKDQIPNDPRLELIRIKRIEAEHSDTPTPAGIREITSLRQLIQD